MEPAVAFGAATPYVAQLVPEMRDRLPDLAAPPAIDSEQARFRLFDSIPIFLRSYAATRPLVLILDDLHWADKSSLLLLRSWRGRPTSLGWRSSTPATPESPGTSGGPGKDRVSSAERMGDIGNSCGSGSGGGLG